MVQFDEKTYGSSKQRLELIFDCGTFVELGAYTKRQGTDTPAGVVCGYGAVSGKLAFAFIQESGRNKGAFDERQSKKIEALYSLAVKNGAPVIGVFDSAGAVVYDGASALAAYGRLMKNISDASGIIPQIAVIDGICGGSSAVAAAMFDFVVTVKDKSKLFVNPPFVVGESADDVFSGNSVYEAESSDDAFSYVKSLINILPENNATVAYTESADDMNRPVAFDAKSYSAKELVANVADDGRFVSVYEKYAANLKLGFVSLGGIVTGIVASERGGVIDIKSARAAAKLVGFCDSFSIPVVTLVDSEGLDVSAEAEKAAYAQELAKLAYAYSASESAKVTVVIGKAYGAAFTLLGSKAMGTDMTLALPTAEISVLSPEASVAFVWNDRVGEQTREELEAEWKEKCASADEAADLGEIDDIIDPAELRSRICAALSMLSAKAEGTPIRKHANMPL
ncbi:MAG: hypothetical protein E7607_03365 [Ruminococcaceae bacterium]|nr:hypothetical protein [Oscillospiraceae bacterium]